MQRFIIVTESEIITQHEQSPSNNDPVEQPTSTATAVLYENPFYRTDSFNGAEK